MANDRIKVAGYSQKVFYNDQIEYRNFSPDLVGLQLASEGGTPLFTMGNFSVTTNLEPKVSKVFTTKKFSNFVSLTDLDLTLQDSTKLLTNNAGVILNLNKTDLINYSLFGSLKELVRVSLENIIINWPAALYVNPVYSIPPLYMTESGKTVENYYYDSVTDKSSFAINTNVINNKFQINYFKNGTTTGTFNETNSLRDLTLNYSSYSILYNDIEYNLIEFTGATYSTNDYVYLVVKGNPFSSITSNEYPVYYVKPNKTNENLFFNSLDDFENYLLNRQVSPKYTSTFSFTIKSDTGNVLYVNESITWPTTDGYNIDFSTDAYEDYITKLLEISTNYDLTTSNLMVRFLVTESISDFDTTDVHLDPLDVDTSGQKVNKTLTIYGVENDKINSYIKGIKFANTVSYDKNDNTPDIYLKNIARILGWDLISSVLENNLLQSYIQPKPSTYSGLEVGLTPVEADIELWRRIILNTPWLWKSKGTRKSIEFLFKFIGTPLGLIKFNEYIYLAENKIDIYQFQQVLFLNNSDENLSNYPVDSDGYPRPLPNTSDLYYQSDGLWYRETGGPRADIDITTGNNPHIGVYDGGYKYINQFRNLIPNFSAVTINSDTTKTTNTNLFTNYNNGTITGYSGQTYVNITNTNGVDFSDCYVLTATTIDDPKNRLDETECGCPCPGELKSLSICVEEKQRSVVGPECTADFGKIGSSGPNEGYLVYHYYQYNPDGSVYKDSNGNPIYYQSKFIDPVCCVGNIPYHYNEVVGTGTPNDPYVVYNSGYICCSSNSNKCGCFVCCNWRIDDKTPTVNIGGNTYLVFKTETNENRVVSQDGTNCVNRYTTKIQITDPYTNEVGFGCQVTTLGLNDINQTNSVIKTTYEERATKKVDCCSEPVEPKPVNVNFVAVALNTSSQIGLTINGFSFEDTNDPNLLSHVYFQAYNRTQPLPELTANTNSVGYYSSYYEPNAAASNGHQIKMIVALQPQVEGLPFSSEVHKMSYYISETEYTNSNFNLVIPRLNNLQLQVDNSGNFIDAKFNLVIPTTTTTNNLYVYMVYDYREDDKQIVYK